MCLVFCMLLGLAFVEAYGITDWSWVSVWALPASVLFALWFLMFWSSKSSYSVREHRFVIRVFSIKKTYKSFSYDFAIVSAYTFKGGRYVNGVRIHDRDKKMYPALSLYKAQNWYRPIRSGMTDEMIRVNQKDKKDDLFVGICWPTALEAVLRETDLIVYILEDIYLEHKDRFDREIASGSYGDRIFIVTDRNIAYNGYTQKH